MDESEKIRKIPAYRREFKAKAVTQCENITVCATSKELGVPTVTLLDWILTSGTHLGQS